MAFSYIDPETIFDAFNDSKKYMRTFQDPLNEYERLARNKPHAGIDKAYPKVTDGTASSIIQKTPRRIIQQLPTGKVISDTNDWLSIVASFIYLNKIIPNANMQYALLQKCWLAVKMALTNGSCTVYTPFIQRGSYFGPDMRIIAPKDILFINGKLSALDSDVQYMRAWYQPTDIDAEIYKQKWLKDRAKARGEKYEPTWKISELKKIRDMVTSKADDQMSRAEKEKQDATHKSGVEVIHAFQRGVGGEFYSFHPQTQKILRTTTNKDPRGEIPLTTLYADVDGYNPLGWGLIEQLAPLQNLMDSDMQMYQFERALMLAPPTVKKGNWNKGQAKLAPNVIVDLGSDPNASWEVLKRESTAIAQYPELYGLMKSQLLNIASSPDTSISSEVGNPGFSKTDSGVKQIASNVSVDDNYFRKQFETFFSAWSETAINLYFAERSGVEEIQVDKETAMKLRKIDESLVGEENMVRIDFTGSTEKLKFEVDASTSNMKSNQEQLEGLSVLLERIDSSPILQSVVNRFPEKIVGIFNSIVAVSGVENPEDLSIDEEEFKQQLEQEQAMAQQQAEQEQAMAEEQAMQEPVEDPAVQEGELVEQPMPEGQPQMSEEDMQFIAQLEEMGYPPEKIEQALAMEQSGMPDEEIIAVLEGAQ